MSKEKKDNNNKKNYVPDPDEVSMFQEQIFLSSKIKQNFISSKSKPKDKENEKDNK